MALSNLPQDILVDIFSRLPAKAVGRCRCLAKRWRDLLSTHQFLRSHFTQKPHQENLILITSSCSILSIDTIENAVPASRNLDLPINIYGVTGSCDGLVLFVDKKYTKFLVNPITLEQVKIPDSPLALAKDESFSMHGFGYDRFNDDYKVVTLSYYEYEGEYDPEQITDIFVDVYSVKRGVWVTVDCSPYDYAVPLLCFGPFVNGAIHWLAGTRESSFHFVIAAFNLVGEVFLEIPTPSGVDLRKISFNFLVVFGGCLCMITCENNKSRTDIWIMKEYGVGDSWTKFIIDVDYDWDTYKPLCFIGDEKIVLLSYKGTLFVYNLKEKTLSEMLIDGVPAKYRNGGAFVESLVSPRKEAYYN